MLEVVKEEPCLKPAKVSRNKQRKSFSRNRTHIGQQSACSDLPPSSPGDTLEPLTTETHDGETPSAPEADAPPSHPPDTSPPHSGSPAPTCRSGQNEWMGVDKQERVASRTPEPPPERPLRISSDPEVLATQLNSLPGMACSSHVYSTPKHYVRFSSPFLANRSPSTLGVPTGRRRSREMPETPTTTGSCKKRWLKQALEEEGSTSPGGGRPSLLMPSESPLSPSINGESYSPLPLNGSCSLPGGVAYPVEEKALMFSRSLYVGDFHPIRVSFQQTHRARPCCLPRLLDRDQRNPALSLQHPCRFPATLCHK
ncbi:hypothetical protein M9458_009436, partial [Cirrhinus mrigala]